MQRSHWTMDQPHHLSKYCYRRKNKLTYQALDMVYSFKDSNTNRLIDLNNIKNRLENMKSDLQIHYIGEKLKARDTEETD